MYTTYDRRAKPRIVCDFAAIIESCDDQGKKYKEQANLANLSVGGLYMWVNRYIEPGSKLAVTVHLCNITVDKDTTKLITRGVVVRTDPHTEGLCGIAIKFHNYRFV